MMQSMRLSLLPAPIILALSDRRIWTYDSPGLLSIRCASGSVWLTCGDGVDHILEEGERWEATRPALIVVEALEPSTLHLEAIPDPRSAGSCVPDPEIAADDSPARDAAGG